MHFLFATIIMAVSWTTSAKELTLTTITINAAVLLPPYYADEAGNPLTNLNFDFQNYADPVPATHVDSDVKYIQLVDATSYPAVVNVTPPTDCTIGATSIDNSHIRLIFSTDTLRQNGGPITFESGVVQTARLRFRQQGNYASFTGVVSCSTNGQMIYSY